MRRGYTGQGGPLTPLAVSSMGGTAAGDATLRANRIGIDTGAGRGGPLTCAVLDGDDVRFLQAEMPSERETPL